MAGKVLRKEEMNGKNDILDTVYICFEVLVDLIISIYMLLILVVQPFYSEEGYSHIGTDKSVLFRTSVSYCGWAVLVALVILAIVKLVLYAKENGKGWVQGCKENVISYFKKELCITDYFAIAYGVAVILSYLCTNYKDEAWMGTKGWFMGMIPQLAFVGSYLLISKKWQWKKMLVSLVLPVSVIVFGLGYLNRIGVYPIKMEPQVLTFVSTIGNINWYCSYLVIIFFGAFAFFWKMDWKNTEKAKWQKISMMAYLVVGFGTLVTNGSSSGILVTAVILLLAFYLSASDGKRMEAFWLEMILFSAICVVTFCIQNIGGVKLTYDSIDAKLFTDSPVPFLMTIVSVANYVWIRKCNSKGTYPEKLITSFARVLFGGVIGVLVLYILLLIINTVSGGIIYQLTGMSENTVLTFSPEWGSKRGATWMAGLYLFWEQNILHKLVGVGPDCMAKCMYETGSTDLLLIVKGAFGDARLTNAHNEWITVLANIGLLGCVSYVGLMLSAVKRYLKMGKEHAFVMACAFAIIAHIVNNMFSFQTSMNMPTLFIVLALGESYLRDVKRDKNALKEKNKVIWYW